MGIGERFGSRPAAAKVCAPDTYHPPRLERLGSWSALTLQQTVPIGPGGFLIDPARTDRLG